MAGTLETRLGKPAASVPMDEFSSTARGGLTRGRRARALAPLEPLPRRPLIHRARKQIHLGLYDQEDKIDAILDRLAADLGAKLRD